MSRVLHLRTSGGLAGPERQLSELIPALGQLGWSSTVALLRRPPRGENGADPPHPHPPHPMLAWGAAAGVPVWELADPGRSPRPPLGALRARLEEPAAPEVALLHGHDYKANLVAALAGRRLGLPVVATVHLHTRSDWRLRLYARFDRALLRRLDAVIVVAARLAAESGLAALRPVVIPNGIDAARWRAAAAPATNRSRSTLGISPDAELVLAVGRLTEQKGLDILLRALPVVIAARRAACVAIAGSGPQRESLERLAAALGVAGHLHWLGERADIAALMAVADVVAVPSRREGLPYVVLEALALGRPVAASAAGGIPELVRDGDTGRLVPVGDAEALGAALAELLAAPAAAAELGQRGRALVEARHSAVAMAARTAEVYRDARARVHRRS